MAKQTIMAVEVLKTGKSIPALPQGMATYDAETYQKAIEASATKGANEAQYKELGAKLYAAGVRPETAVSPKGEDAEKTVTVNGCVIDRVTHWIEFCLPVLVMYYLRGAEVKGSVKRGNETVKVNFGTFLKSDIANWGKWYRLGITGRKELPAEERERFQVLNGMLGGYTGDIRRRLTVDGSVIKKAKPASGPVVQSGTNSAPEDTQPSEPESIPFPEEGGSKDTPVKNTREKARGAARTICAILESDHADIPEAEFYQAAQNYLNDSAL